MVLHYGLWVITLHLHDFLDKKLFLPSLTLGKVISIALLHLINLLYCCLGYFVHLTYLCA